MPYQDRPTTHEKEFCHRTRKEDAFFSSSPTIQCLEEQQERKHGDPSEPVEAAASSAGEPLMDYSTYFWKKPLSQFTLSFFLHTLPPNYTNEGGKEEFQKLC